MEVKIRLKKTSYNGLEEVLGKELKATVSPELKDGFCYVFGKDLVDAGANKRYFLLCGSYYFSPGEVEFLEEVNFSLEDINRKKKRDFLSILGLNVEMVDDIVVDELYNNIKNNLKK